MKARISEIKAEHRNQLSKALKYLKRKDHASLEEFYSACEEFDPWDSSNVSVIKVNICSVLDLFISAGIIIQSIYGMHFRLLTHKSEDFMILLRELHIKTLMPLYRKLRELQIIEDRARQHRAKIFPKTTQAWRELDTKDAKLAVARFLMLDKIQQEDHLKRNQTWKDSKADVDYIRDEYGNNVSFCHLEVYSYYSYILDRFRARSQTVHQRQ